MDLRSRREAELRATATVAADRPVLVTGPPGSGRSRLLHGVAARIRGRPVRFIAGHDAAQAIPLAPAAPLVAALGLDPADVLAVYGRLPGLLRAEDAVVMVDDVDLADHATCVLVAQCIRAGVAVALTSAGDVPAGLRDLRMSGRWEHVALRPLSADEVADLAESRFGVPLDVPSLARLARAGKGLPGLLVELLEAGAEGAVPGDHGLRLGPEVLTDALREATAERLHGLAADVVETVDIVCAVGRVPEEALDPALLDRAIEAGLLRTAEEGGSVVLPADDLLRAAIADRLGTVTCRRLTDEIRRRLSERPPSSVAGRTLRVLLEVADGDRIGRDAALEAASCALTHHRPEEAALIVSSVGGTSTDADLLLLRGRARAEGGDPDGAVRDLADAARLAEGEVLARTGRELGVLHAVRREDPATAVEVVTAVVERLPEELAAGLQADLVKWRLMAGLPADPAVLSEEARRAGEAADRIGVAVIEAMIASLDGPVDRAVEVVTDGLERVGAALASPPYAVDLLRLSGYLAASFAGDLARAESDAITWAELAVREEHPSAGMWEYARAELALHAGRMEESAALVRRSVGHLAWHDFTGLRPSARALQAAVEARSGRLGAARELTARIAPDAREDVKVDLHLARVEAATETDVSRAAAILGRAADRALAASHAHLALMAHDEAFLLSQDPGERRDIAAVLVEHADRSALFAALARRAEAILSGDLRALEEAAWALAGTGLLGRAAHAYDAAAAGHRERGNREAAARLGAASHDLRRRVGRMWPEPAALESLSPREREIAVLAGRLRSREIAERLGVSTRTIDNHLARIFTKLGVANRGDLPTVLGGVEGE